MLSTDVLAAGPDDDTPTLDDSDIVDVTDLAEEIDDVPESDFDPVKAHDDAC